MDSASRRAETDDAAAEEFFRSLEREALSRKSFPDTRGAQAVVPDWCYGFYNQETRPFSSDRRNDASATLQTHHPANYTLCLRRASLEG